MGDAKRDEALARAKANGEALRIELDGQPVVTFSTSGELKVYGEDPARLRAALKLIVKGLEELRKQVEHALSHEALLHLAMGAVTERLHAQAPAVSAEPFAKGAEPLTFTMPTPKGRAS